MKVIINADDFGISTKVNRAIYNSAIDGYITSSTIMAVSAYLNEAVEMTKDLKNISFGIHLTFTDNFKSILEKPILFSSNDIIKLKGMNFFKLNILVDEFSQQIEKLLNKGINISHIDTHHHIHLYPLVMLSVMKVANKYGITKIRSQKIIAKDINMIWFNKTYRYLHHNLVNKMGFVQPSCYTDFATFLNLNIQGVDDNIYEIMCHPGSLYNDEQYFNKDVFTAFQNNMINYHEL